MHALEGQWDIVIFSPWGKITCLGVFKTEVQEEVLKGYLRYGDPLQNYPLQRGKTEGLNFSFEAELDAFFTLVTLEIRGKVEEDLKNLSGLARAGSTLIEFYGKKRGE